MRPEWLLGLALLAALLLGALAATAFWWWSAPRALQKRWSAPLRDALDAGFSDQALQYRLRSQADKMWARKQQRLWQDNLELIHARHEACLLAEIRLLLRPPVPPVPPRQAAPPSAAPAPRAGTVGPSGAVGRRPVAAAAAAPPRPPAPPVPALPPVSAPTPMPAPAPAPEMPLAALSDAQLDALAPELPAAAPSRRRAPPTPYRPL